MLPGDTPRGNLLPIIRFAGHGLIVAALSTHLAWTAYKAAIHTSLSAYRRSQHFLRGRNATAFSVLAFLSLASVSAFAFRWRALSYMNWARLHDHKIPNSLWSGWSGAANDAVGHWRLGDWLADVDLRREADAISILTPEGFLYTTQHFIGQLITSIFVGVEAQKRNLPRTVIASLVMLGSVGSLGFAQSLFFVIILYMPPGERHAISSLHSSLSAPHREFYYYPLALILLTLGFLPGALRNGNSLSPLRSVYLLAPFFFAFLPKFATVSMRAQHTSTKNVYRCYAAVYRQLSTVSTILYIRAIFSSIYSDTPSDPSYIQDVFSNTITFPINAKSMRFFSGTSAAGLNIAPLSKHPIISATSLDVMFAAINLLGWVYICNPDVESLLESSTLYYVIPRHTEKIVSDDLDVREIIDQQGHNVFTDPNGPRAPVSVTRERFPAPTAPRTTGTRTSGTTETRTPMARTRPRNRYVAPSTSASKRMASPDRNINSTTSASGSNSSSSSAGSNSTSSSARAMPPPPLPPRLRSSQPAVSAPITRSAAANATTAGSFTAGTAAANATNAPAASAPAAAGPPATPARRGRVRGAPSTRRSARVRDYKTKDALSRSVDSEGDLYSDLDSDSDSDSGPSSESSSGLSSSSGQSSSSGSSDSSSGCSGSSSDVRSIPRPASAGNGTDDLTYARAGDAVALALFSMLTGGLGALGAAVLGAETMG